VTQRSKKLVVKLFVKYGNQKHYEKNRKG